MVSATTESPVARVRQYGLGNGHLTPEQKIQVRTLYLNHNMRPKDICARMGGNYKSVSDLIANAGWAKLRNRNWAKSEAEIVAIVERDIAEVTQKLAVESEELTFGSLRVLRDSIAKGCAKDMQMASGAARNLVEISRRCRNMDNRLDQSAGSATVNLNFFALGGQAGKPVSTRPELNVTPKTETPIAQPTATRKKR